MRVRSTQRRRIDDTASVQRVDTRSERGAELVEFAIVITLLLLLVFGIIGFGLTIWSDVNLANAVREGARNTVVKNYSGNNGSCTGLPGAQAACFVRADSGLKSASVSVTVKFPASYAVGQEVLVCAAYPMTDIGGLTAPFLKGRYLKTKTAMRLEQVESAAPADYTSDTDPTGSSWSWCT